MLPIGFSDFLNRIAANYDDSSIELSGDDKQHLIDFGTFNQKILLRVYRCMWSILRSVESGECSKGGNHDLDSILSDQEQFLQEKRIEICMDPTHDVFKIFFAIPILETSLLSPNNSIIDIYPSYTALDHLLYPPWIQSIAEEKCSSESLNGLKRLVFGLYEIQVYDAYCRAFGLQKYCDDSALASNKELRKELGAEANDSSDSSDAIDANDDNDASDDNGYSLYYNDKVKSIIYYITCATYRKMLGLLVDSSSGFSKNEQETIINALHKKCIVCPSKADQLGLPISRVRANAKALNKLLYVSKELYDLVVTMEVEVLQGWFENTKILILMCNGFRKTLESKIKNNIFYSQLESILLSALKDDDEVQKLSIDEAKINSTVSMLREKFFDYYINTACGDFNKKVIPILRESHKTMNEKNIPWRLLLQMKNTKN